MASTSSIPSSILVIGSGVFGLSTAYALSQRPEFQDTKITLLDRSTFPAPDGSSVDSSRIVRADYADISYAQLCLEAQDKWRDTWIGENAYHEDGLVIALKTAAATENANEGEAKVHAKEYMRSALENVKRLGMKEGPGNDVEVLPSKDALAALFHQPNGEPVDGSNDNHMSLSTGMGYINRKSGWVDATAALSNLRRAAEATNRITFLTGQAKRLIFTPNGNQHTVTGVELSDSSTLSADLTLVAAGAWTPSLIDLRGLASATGQVVGYIPLSPPEAATLARNPTLIDESNGLFIITPSAGHLKVARHGYGYANPTSIPNPEPSNGDEHITVSLPRTTWDDGAAHGVPQEGKDAMRAFLRATFPSLAEREFSSTRICWYTDTVNGDWLIDYHPKYEGLFVATGGSGHAFKFAPVVGDCIVDRILRKEVRYGLGEKWAWPKTRGKEDLVWTEDWRGGRKGMVLADEYKTQ